MKNYMYMYIILKMNDDIPGLTIIENFIDKHEEKELVEFIKKQPWMTSLSRRVQHYGYEYGYSPPYKITKTIDIPKLFEKYSKQINTKFNQVIVNEYKPGQGIGKHTDHKQYFGDVIASISLLSATTITFSYNNYSKDIYVLPRTLVIMEDEARWKFTHQICPRKYDIVNGNIIKRNTRISLTFRTYII